MKPIISNDRTQTPGPHPEEAALFARPSRRMATGTISLVAVLRDARKSALLRTRLRLFHTLESGRSSSRTRSVIWKGRRVGKAKRAHQRPRPGGHGAQERAFANPTSFPLLL